MELLPNGAVVKTPWPDDRKLHAQKDICAEAQAYQRLAERSPGHNRFVKLIEFDQEQHTLTMEVVSEGTLRAYLEARNEHITRHQRHLWIKAMAEGLMLLHSAAIIHCDLSPHITLLDGQLELKIADFGCCLINQSTILGGTKALICSAWGSWRTSARCEDDIFALGSCIYEVLTGAPPYEDNYTAQAEISVGVQQLPEFAALDFRDIVRDCWLLKAEYA